ncbi:hypothetical protein NLJ89_g7138 [Agrocybe chaxingu]|uniref:Uncharacterized protein n=1 Tax=Agrocybe chaxingu TaxID=84603 RepID=A0A9W8JX87_9AGAR|nr:hypothetical protein NLJ89_g7138 [Agrocybe chaxingu]
MSVTSLPAYNKEPGEEELVIFRGRDMEDATMPAAVVMNSVDEDRDESIHSNDNSQVSRYSPMPATTNDMPLLHSDGTYGDLSLQSLSSPEQDLAQRRSSDTASHETSSLVRIESNQLPEGLPDPRGEVPAYFEVLDQNFLPSPQGQSDATPAQPASPESRPQRQSGFRTLLTRMSIVAHPNSHHRGDSAGSGISSNQSHGAESSNSRHRASPSSSSILSSSMFRTLSRQKSIHTLNSARLNSPSMISLNSISAPLTHTAVRTEFTYPKTGPTPEQLKLISSRESFARFGVPYGADAIAYAASTSRLDLLPPPPDFETASSDIQSPRSAAGPSRLRSSSNAPEPQERQSTADVDERDRTSSDRNPDESDIQPQPSSTTAPANVSNTSSQAAGLPTSETQAPSGSSISTNHNSISKASVQSQSAESQPSTVQIPAQAVSEFGKLSAPPPSSYHDVTAGSSRSESALSMYSYATAAESLTASTPRRSSFVSMDSAALNTAPSTPRIGQHILEATDVTVTPNTIRN